MKKMNKSKYNNAVGQTQYLNMNKLPKHVGIIMDGNGRWARERNLPRTLGHRAGVEALRDVIKTSSDIGLQDLSLYAFSTENWKRPQEEISALMKLLLEFLKKEIKDLHKNNIKINILGVITEFPIEVQNAINDAKQLTGKNTGLRINIALNYGGRDEILRAVKYILNDLVKGLDINELNEELIKGYLDTRDISDPDLIIRTGGEYRLSNFLLWQSAYAELYFSKKYWPDFTGTHLKEAIVEYQNRSRRFGGI